MASEYSDSKFHCPLCSTSVMIFKKEGVTFIYCPVCAEEMLVIREPKTMSKESEHEIKH